MILSIQVELMSIQFIYIEAVIKLGSQSLSCHHPFLQLHKHIPWSKQIHTHSHTHTSDCPKAKWKPFFQLCCSEQTSVITEPAEGLRGTDDYLLDSCQSLDITGGFRQRVVVLSHCMIESVCGYLCLLKYLWPWMALLLSMPACGKYWVGYVT